MSIGFLLNDQDAAVIWRGPRKTAMIRQFLTDVDWGELDFLIVDSPPGTSDEHISVVECLNNLPTKCQTNAILVTTPQSVAVGDVRREITFCHKGNVPILGLIENMSGYVCQHCSVSVAVADYYYHHTSIITYNVNFDYTQECSPIFSQGGGQTLAEYAQLDLLVTIPIETGLAECCDEGSDFIEKYPESETFKRFSELSNKICNKLCIQS